MKDYSGKREVLKYNSKGQAIGKASQKLSTFLGALSRTLVPIIFETWFKVPEELKDEIWSHVKVYKCFSYLFINLVPYLSQYKFDVLNF